MNTDDPLLAQYHRDDVQIVRVGQDEKNDVWGRIESIDTMGCVQFSVRNEWRVNLQVPGKHQFYNALLAIAVGETLGIEREEMIEALETFQAPHQRMQTHWIKGVLVVNDVYNANPDSTRAAIEFLASLPQKGKKILVLGDMLELGDMEEQLHREIGKFILNYAIDRVLLYGPATKATAAAIREQQPHFPVFHFQTHKDLTEYLLSMLHSGDVVLIKGSRGMQMETVLSSLTGEVE